MSTSFDKTHGKKTTRDWQRVNLLYQQCKVSDFFFAPKPISKTTEIIKYEKLKGLSPLLNKDKKLQIDFYQLGFELARLQQTTSSSMDIDSYNDELLCFLGLDKSECEYLNNLLPITFFHSDLWHGNILQSSNSNLVILDPCPTFLFKGFEELLYVNSAIDIATLHMSILLVRPLSCQLTQNNDQLLKKNDALLKGYLAFFPESKHLKQLILKISYNLALRFVTGYKERLYWPFSKFKTIVANKKITYFNDKISWNE